MRPICDLCTHQESDNRGGVRCGATRYRYDSEGYGPSKEGAACIHDDDLKDHFAPRTGNEIDIRNMSAMKHNQYVELCAAKERIRALELRLITVEKAS
jgi:hypothetical protein